MVSFVNFRILLINSLAKYRLSKYMVTNLHFYVFIFVVIFAISDFATRWHHLPKFDFAIHRLTKFMVTNIYILMSIFVVQR